MLAVLALRARDPLGVLLALFGADLFVWNFADLAYKVSGLPVWHVLDITASPRTPVLGLHFVLLFVGRRRELGRLRMLVYALFGALSLSLSSAVALVTPEHRPLLGTQAWSALFLTGTLAVIVFGAGLLVHFTPGDDLPACAADRDLLARALENLMKNAFEAMPDGGALTVTVESLIDGERARAQRLVIRIADTGSGMNARTRERIFDDFYTTKATGSGLGLPFVKRVIEAHGGDVTLVSEVGRGSVFTLRLPAFQAPLAESHDARHA